MFLIAVEGEPDFLDTAYLNAAQSDSRAGSQTLDIGKLGAQGMLAGKKPLLAADRKESAEDYQKAQGYQGADP